LSRVRSATTRLRRPFSSFSRRSSLASSAFMPPAVLIAPAAVRLLADLQRPCHLGHVHAFGGEALALAELADHLLRCVLPSLHRVPPASPRGLENSHISWTSFQGSGHHPTGWWMTWAILLSPSLTTLGGSRAGRPQQLLPDSRQSTVSGHPHPGPRTEASLRRGCVNVPRARL
jgi:hypothetical protein